MIFIPLGCKIRKLKLPHGGLFYKSEMMKHLDLFECLLESSNQLNVDECYYLCGFYYIFYYNIFLCVI